MSVAAPVVPDILEEHLEELAFLSLQRRKLLFDWETLPHELAGHDARIEAHRAGLVIGADASVEIALARLDEAVMDWEIYACVRTWLELGEPDGAQISERLEATDVEKLGGWREALRRTDPARWRELLPRGHENGRALAADALGWHGLLGERAARDLARDESPQVRFGVARALAAAPFDPMRLIEALQADGEAGVRRASLWAAVLRDAPGTLSRLRLGIGEADDFALRVIGLLGGPGDLRPLAGRVRDTPAAIRAMGDLLDPRALYVLLELAAVDDEDRAGAAREAIEMIVGEPDLDAGDEEPTSLESLRAQVEARSVELPDASRLLRGHPFPPVEDEHRTTEAGWRLAVAGDSPERGRRLREVPDGFWSGAPEEEARCGE